MFTSPVHPAPGHLFWSCFKSQYGCMVANDNMTTAQRVQVAQDLRRWAESKHDMPSFSGMAHAAMVEHYRMMREFAPRAVEGAPR